MGYLYFVGGTIQGSATMGRLIDLTDYKGSGYTDGGYIVMTSNGFNIASGVVVGDLEFSDLTCEKCHRRFEEGDELHLIVVALGDGTIRTRPCHRFCKEV